MRAVFLCIYQKNRYIFGDLQKKNVTLQRNFGKWHVNCHKCYSYGQKDT